MERVRSSVRPLNAAFSEAAGRYGDLRIRSKSFNRAQRSRHFTGFTDPDLFDHFAHSGRRLLTPPLSDIRHVLRHADHACAGALRSEGRRVSQEVGGSVWIQG